MPIELPSPIRTYVAANARLDADGMLSAFADDAVVSDEARRHAGRDDIRAWILDATIANRAVFTPETCRMEDGIAVVEGPTAGDFPGSPIRLTFRFALRGDAITALEIAG
ncbi:MAG: nuclear transport factor 2 family protein [Phenylobacterium sp.]|nr:nuclear transport factor 2 family protein [Phenylobacterium sp.]